MARKKANVPEAGQWPDKVVVHLYKLVTTGTGENTTQNTIQVEVDKKEFERAQPGMAYYVAFYSESDLAFSCFDVEWYEPDPAMLR